MHVTENQYYCIHQRRESGDWTLRWKTRRETESKLSKILAEFPVPTRFFIQVFALDANSSPNKLLREETIGLYHGYAEALPTAKDMPYAARKAEW